MREGTNKGREGGRKEGTWWRLLICILSQDRLWNWGGTRQQPSCLLRAGQELVKRNVINRSTLSSLGTHMLGHLWVYPMKARISLTGLIWAFDLLLLDVKSESMWDLRKQIPCTGLNGPHLCKLHLFKIGYWTVLGQVMCCFFPLSCSALTFSVFVHHLIIT